jgi:hypothetical protein
MSVSFQLPADLERKLRAASADLGGEAKEAYLLELFRQGKLTHFELSQGLGLDRVETDAFLKRHDAYQGSLTAEDIEADRETLQRVLGRTER